MVFSKRCHAHAESVPVSLALTLSLALYISLPPLHRPAHYEAVAPVQATRSNRVARVLAAIGVVVLCVAVVALTVPGAGPSVLDSRVAKVGLVE